jgi:hypothetical protein
MKTQLLKFGLVIALGMIWGSCNKADIPTPQISWHAYTGNWENINAFAANISRITITNRERGQISVQLWGSCGQEICEWALLSYSEPDLNEAFLPIHFLRDGREWSLRLSITASGKLELAPLQGNPGPFDTQYFSWMQTASFYQQVGQVDARSLDLAAKRINGSPRDPDNLLYSGTILVFQTNEGRLGKIQVHSNDSFLSLRWQIWSADGTIHQSIDYYPLYKIGYYDLDHGKMDDSPDHLYSDFFWSLEGQTIRWLEPLNGAAFAVYHLN